MLIKTSRFGNIEVSSEDIIQFDEGILGFDHLKKFFIVDPGDKTLILWMQSSEDPKVAFPIIEPKIFQPNYIIKLLPSELNSLDLKSVAEASIYAILTIPKEVTKMSANMKAPVIINNATKKARQIVLQDNKLAVALEMYKDLKQYIVDYSSSDDQRSQQVETTQTAEVETTPAPRQKDLEAES